MKKIISFLLLYIFAIATNSCTNSATSASEIISAKYQCPMDCENGKVYDKAGNCPVCGMALKEVQIKTSSSKKTSDVKIAGAMMNVMHKGELSGTIYLDTLPNKTNLFGIGPVEFLKGEILIIDGKCFVSRVSKDGSITIEENYKTKAPFFVYQNVEKWNEFALPDSVHSILQLESFLDLSTKNHTRPFAFKLTTTIDTGEIHIVNLPDGVEVHSPDDAHKNQKSYILSNERVELIGFFSTEHQGVFTHHDNYTHIHLITSDRKKMGHLDKMYIKKGSTKLYLPSE